MTDREREMGGGQSELLGFLLADEDYALEILEIREILRMRPVTPVPRSPAWLKGIASLRGVIIPIFDLRSRLGLREVDYGPDTRIIVVNRAAPANAPYLSFSRKSSPSTTV